MAKLNAFKVNSAAREAGEWVKPGEEYDDLEILARGFTDVYTDSHQAKLRKAARGFNGDTRLLPVAVSRTLLVESLLQHVVLDVRNLAHPDGTPVSFAEFSALLREPDYQDLVSACIKAASQVGIIKQDDTKDATGNSAPPSA